MPPKLSQERKVSTTAEKFSQLAHERHERNFKFHSGMLRHKVLREKVLITKIFERFSPIFSHLDLCQIHRLHKTIKDRQAHMHPVSYVLDPMFVGFKIAPKVARALRFHDHITTTHSAMEVRRLRSLHHSRNSCRQDGGPTCDDATSCDCCISWAFSGSQPFRLVHGILQHTVMPFPKKTRERKKNEALTTQHKPIGTNASNKQQAQATGPSISNNGNIPVRIVCEVRFPTSSTKR